MSVNWHEVTAVFGGTFDPPHLGHREAVRGLFRIPGVRRVIIVPAAAPPHKPTFIPQEHRLEMTRLNFTGFHEDPYPAELEIDLCEIDQARRKPGPTYTYETLLTLGQKYAKLAFAIGTDQLQALPSWGHFPAFLKLCHWIVLERRPGGPEAVQRGISQLEASGLIRADGSFEGLRTWKIPGGNTQLIVVPTEAPPLSSTEIRETIGRTGNVPAGALLAAVARYLNENGLYDTRKDNYTR